MLQSVLCKTQLLYLIPTEKKLSKNKHGISHHFENILCTQFYYNEKKKRKDTRVWFSLNYQNTKEMQKVFAQM